MFCVISIEQHVVTVNIAVTTLTLEDHCHEFVTRLPLLKIRHEILTSGMLIKKLILCYLPDLISFNFNSFIKSLSIEW